VIDRYDEYGEDALRRPSVSTTTMYDQAPCDERARDHEERDRQARDYEERDDAEECQGAYSVERKRGPSSHRNNLINEITCCEFCRTGFR